MTLPPKSEVIAEKPDDFVWIAILGFSLPLVFSFAIAPSFQLDTTLVVYLVECAAMGLFSVMAFLSAYRTDLNYAAIDEYFVPIASHVAFFLFFVVDRFVPASIEIQALLGIFAWLAGALAVRALYYWTPPQVAGVLPFTMTAILAQSSLMGCVLIGPETAGAILVAVLVGLCYTFTLFRNRPRSDVKEPRDAGPVIKVLFLATGWTAFYVFQQAAQYCVVNVMLWIPFVVYFIVTSYQFIRSLLSTFQTTNGKPNSENTRNIGTFVFTTVYVCFVISTRATEINYVASIVGLLLFFLVIYLQTTTVRYALDALVIGAEGLYWSVASILAVPNIPGVAIAVFGVLWVAFVAYFAFAPYTVEKPPWSYTIAFALWTELLYGLLALLAASQPGLLNPFVYVTYSVGILVYGIMFSFGFSRLLIQRSFTAILFTLATLTALGGTFGLYFNAAQLSTSQIVLGVYSILFVFLAAGILIYREWELGTQRKTGEDDGGDETA